MIRPNIRGIPRSALRFTMRGWQFRDSEATLVLFSPPWRRNWVDFLSNHSNAVARLDRNGVVRLILQVPIRPPRRVKFVSRKRILGVSSLVLICLIASFVPLETSTSRQADTSIQTSASMPTSESSIVSECSRSIDKPQSLLHRWLENLETAPVQVDLLRKTRLGGVLSIDLKFTCDRFIRSHRFGLFLTDGTWELKKSVRLAD